MQVSPIKAHYWIGNTLNKDVKEWKQNLPDSCNINLSFSSQNDEPPEITYCVVGGEGGLALQAVTPTHPMPPQDELDAKFAELVVSTNCFPTSSLWCLLNGNKMIRRFKKRVGLKLRSIDRRVWEERWERLWSEVGLYELCYYTDGSVWSPIVPIDIRTSLVGM